MGVYLSDHLKEAKGSRDRMLNSPAFPVGVLSDFSGCSLSICAFLLTRLSLVKPVSAVILNTLILSSLSTVFSLPQDWSFNSAFHCVPAYSCVEYVVSLLFPRCSVFLKGGFGLCFC